MSAPEPSDCFGVCPVCLQWVRATRPGGLALSHHRGYSGLCPGTARKTYRDEAELSAKMSFLLAAPLEKLAAPWGEKLQEKAAPCDGKLQEGEGKKRKPRELCQGGTRPKPGCVPCGDAMYMITTGRAGQPGPAGYDGWRAEYERLGIPYARERMESHVTVSHVLTMFDPGYQPPAPGGPPSQARRVTAFSGVCFAFAGALAALMILFAGAHSLMYLLLIPFVVSVLIAIGDLLPAERGPG